MAFSKLLKGIDVPTIALVLVASRLWSMVLSLVALTVGTFGNQRYWQVILTLGILIGLLLGLSMALQFVAFRMNFAFEFDSLVFWSITAVIATFVGAYCVLFLQIAIGQLTFDADNRTTGVRLAAAGVFWLALTWAFVGTTSHSWFGMPSFSPTDMNAQLLDQEASSFEAEVPGGLGRLTVELSADDDGLAIDNRVELIEPQARLVTVAVSHPQADSVRSIRRVLDALPEVQTGDLASAQLVFAAAGSLPESNPRRWWAGIGPLSTEKDELEAAKDVLGPYLIDKRQPLLEGVVLNGVVWGGVQPVAYDVTPLISSGNLALVSRLNGTRTTGFVFNIDLSRSNLAESPDWPILIANLVELRRESLPGLARWNYRLGEDVRFRLFEGEGVGETSVATDPLKLVHDGKTKSVARGSLVELPSLDETGVYEVQDGQNVVGRFAVNFFDAEESDLRNLMPGRREARTKTGNSSISLDNPYSWFILALLLVLVACVFADWFVLKRN